MRAYIIGNGKSLKPEQLNRIIGQPSFACNRINLIYPETKWRPTHYVHPESLAPDVPFIQEHVDMGIPCWIGEHFTQIEDAPNIKWLNDCHHHLYNFNDEEVPDEWHMPQPCTFGGSVNVAMQAAVLRGFDELVLLGCDLEYRNGKGKSHFSRQYEHGKEQPAFYAARNALFGHLQALNWIRRKHKDIRVLNATEGGMLELWERVRLEDVAG